MNKRKIRFWEVMLLLLGVLVLCFGVFRIATKMQLRRRIDAIRAAGQPVTLTELDAWYEKPVLGSNAADYITEAFACLHIPEREERERIPLFGTTRLPARVQPLDQEMQDVIEGLLAKNVEALALLHQSASIKQSRYPIDFTRSRGVLLPHIAEMSKAARLLALEAIASANRRQAEPAAQALASAYALARSLLHEPHGISLTVRHTCDEIATDALEQVLNRVRLSDDQLRELDRTIGTACDPNALMRALAGERCMGHEVFRHPGSLGFPSLPNPGQPSILAVRARQIAGILDREWIVFLDRMEQSIRAVRLPAHERLPAVREIARRLGAPRSGANNTITDYVTPSVGALVCADLTDLARLRIARTVLAVERYRLAKDRLPESLDNLASAYLSAPPLDPFDGQPLRYKMQDAGYVVYSIGRDHTDNGGEERLTGRAARQHIQYDITFIVER